MVEYDALSVVVPLYNGATYLAQTLDSLAAQTARDRMVVLAVDDGLTDNGAEIASAHPVVIQVLTQPNSGVAVARNHGLARTSTRWVSFLDQDDIWHPTRGERLLADLNSGRDLLATTEQAFALSDEAEGLADKSIGHWASIQAGRESTLADLSACDVSGSELVESFGPTQLLAGPQLVSTSFAASADLLRFAGGFAPHALAMDDYWLLVNASRLTPMVKVDQPTLFYRVHLGSTSRTTALAMPFLTSALALRHGGQLDPSAPTGKLHSHLLDELLTSAEYADDPHLRRVARHVATALLEPGQARARVGKTEVKRRLPWLVPLVQNAKRKLS